MAFISNLLSVSQPKGFWINIITAFENVTKNYVLAIIFLTVVIRVIWGIVDTASKYNAQSMSATQAKMKPELEKIKAKYANQPEVLQQKQNELNKKYFGKSQYGSCVLTMIIMALNMLIFFTLFSGLNTMSSYKIYSNYDNIKYTYANCLNVVDKYWADDYSDETKKEIFKDYENLSFLIDKKGGQISLVYSRQTGTETSDEILSTISYQDDFSQTVTVPPQNPGEEETQEIISSNQNIIKLIEKYFPVYAEGEAEGSKEIVLQEAAGEEKAIYLSTVLNNLLTKEVVSVYDSTRESFLWIKNVWIADSPFKKSIVSYETLKSQVGGRFAKDEEQIYNAFMPELREERSEVNGYFILSILCVLSSVLIMQLTKIYNKRKNKKKGLPPPASGAVWAQLIAPIIMGIFALLYNSVFAIYMLVGQLVSCVLLIPQLMFVDFIMDKRKNKANKNTPQVDYSRKF